MQLKTGGNDVHHHGLLSGLGAGAAGVLAVLALMFAAWGQVSHAVGAAATVIIWALAAGVVAFVALEIAVRVLRVRHHVLHPETLVPRAVRAEVIPAQVVTSEVPALPPGMPPAWRVLPQDPEAAIDMIRAITAGRERPAPAVIPSDAEEWSR